MRMKVTWGHHVFLLNQSLFENYPSTRWNSNKDTDLSALALIKYRLAYEVRRSPLEINRALCRARRKMGSGTPQERNDIALKLTENEVGNRNTCWLLDAI